MNSNEELIDVASKCRICLKIKNPLYHLSSEVRHCGENFAFKELMQRLISSEISLTDFTSKGICLDCMEALVRAYNFVDSIRNAEKYWRNIKPDYPEANKTNKLQIVKSSEQLSLEETTEQQFTQENTNRPTNLLEELGHDYALQFESESTIDAQNGTSNSAASEDMEIDAISDDDNFDIDELIEVDYLMQESEDALAEAEMEAPNVRFEQDEYELITSCFMDCAYCGKRKKKEKYEIHLMRFHIDVYKENIAVAKKEKRLYKCEHCNMEFCIGICYEDHLKVSHKSNENEIIYICPLCKRSFRKEHYFKRHFKYCASGQVSTTEISPIIEKKSNFASEEMPTIKNDENVADSKQSFSNDPIALEESSSESESPLPATANDADSDSDYWAPYWSENEKESEALNGKIVKSAETTSEQNQDKFPCTHCSKMFRRKYDLRKHLREKHNISVTKQEGTFACSHCPREFPFLHRLEAHQMFSHKDIYPCKVRFEKIYRRYLCHYCGHMVRKIQQHVWRHENYKPYKCQYCDISFVAKTSLNDHERVHTGEKPYKCEVCGKCFRKGPAKITHMLVHDKEKWYKCNFCEKQFLHLNTLKTHINVHHTGERPYACNVCDERFASYGVLFKHRKTKNHKDTGKKDKFANARVGKNIIRWKS